jgi:hypothetical protein
MRNVLLARRLAMMRWRALIVEPTRARVAFSEFRRRPARTRPGGRAGVKRRLERYRRGSRAFIRPVRRPDRRCDIFQADRLLRCGGGW